MTRSLNELVNKSRSTPPPSRRRRFGEPRRSSETTPSGGGRPRRPQRKNAQGFLSVLCVQTSDFFTDSNAPIAISSFSRHLRDDPDVFYARPFEPLEDVHEFLELNAAVAAQVHLLVAPVFHLLPNALLQDLYPNRFITKVHDVTLPVGERHADKHALARNLRRTPGHRQPHVDAALNHGRGDHEDDEQHQHDVNETHP